MLDVMVVAAPGLGDRLHQVLVEVEADAHGGHAHAVVRGVARGLGDLLRVDDADVCPAVAQQDQPACLSRRSAVVRDALDLVAAELEPGLEVRAAAGAECVDRAIDARLADAVHRERGDDHLCVVVVLDQRHVSPAQRAPRRSPAPHVRLAWSWSRVALHRARTDRSRTRGRAARGGHPCSGSVTSSNEPWTSPHAAARELRRPRAPLVNRPWSSVASARDGSRDTTDRFGCGCVRRRGPPVVGRAVENHRGRYHRTCRGEHQRRGSRFRHDRVHRGPLRHGLRHAEARRALMQSSSRRGVI